MFERKLDGEWQFRSDLSPEWQVGQVPGCVHSDLLRLKSIPDPNWRMNELDLQWIGKTAWTYRRTFSIEPAALHESHILLRAEGLDTLATVRINGQEVARADNMHRTWEWEVKNFLREGENEIEVRFDSPLPYLTEKGKIHPLEAWNEYYDIHHRGWLRKQHSNFGWDWTPVLVSVGIWRSLSLVAWSGPRLLDVRIDQLHGKDGVTLTARVGLSESMAAGSLEMEVIFKGKSIAKGAAPVGQTASASVELPIPDPQLWWPAGMGAQPLYEVRVRVRDDKNVPLDSWQRKIGLRTLRLIRKPDAHGESFYFEANGTPFFAKGANWVNPRPYPEWPADGRWKDRLRDAVAAHHNMIRVWGGAYFAPDEFYDFCDEIGLTVWQDFLYGCGPYPAFDEAFLANIDAEARDNVRRMRHHPSLALWCGNNELEHGPFVGESWTNMRMSFEDYDRIFSGILKNAVEELDPQASYWPASPVCTGPDRKSVSEDAGDAHVWEIWFSDAPFENFRKYKNRFISEYGFQSMPALKTIETFTLPEDRQYNSPVLEHRQRSAPGNAQHIKAMLNWFRLPETFADQVSLSQLTQAICVKIGAEHWRRLMPRTMGVLYWQLNDCWPCPSWSSIDFEGRWKALHYFSARFFSPVLISGIEDAEKGTVEVHLTNDQPHAVPGVVTWKVIDLEGNVLLEESRKAAGPALTSGVVATVNLAKIKPHPVWNEALIRPRLAWDDVLVQLEFRGEDGSHSSNLILLERPKKMELGDPGLTFSIKARSDDSFEISVAAQRPAPWVWLETEVLDLKLSNNFFSLFPGQDQKIIARPSKPVTAEGLRTELKLRHLRSTY
jgi:beta-mannosidase